MSSPSGDALKLEVDAGKMKVGNQVLASTGLPVTANALPYADSASTLAVTTVTASKPVYINSSSVPQTGAFPFSVPVSGLPATSTAFVDVTGFSSLSGHSFSPLFFIPYPSPPDGVRYSAASIPLWDLSGFSAE